MSSTSAPRTIAMLVGGGPAPGLNGVINAGTLSREPRLAGAGRAQGVFPANWPATSGACVGARRGRRRRHRHPGRERLYTARANPTKKQEDLDAVVAALTKLEVTDLVTLGGDDTASSGR